MPGPRLKAALVAAPLLLGCDFSSSPSRQKTIVIATGRLVDAGVALSNLEYFTSLEAWAARLAQPGERWVGGFDMPFGLPRELVQALGWPTDWSACMDHYQRLSRADIRSTFKAFCEARPVGQKFAHRATDGPAGSSPSMKWVNPPVAFMLHAGLPLLRQAGVHMPGLMPTPAQPPERVALEAYPGLLARAVLARRSYKSDDKLRQTPDRLDARRALLASLEAGQFKGLRLQLAAEQRALLVSDARGDSMDAVLCQLQAAWALQQHQQGAPLYGLPPDMDPLEGWIVGA